MCLDGVRKAMLDLTQVESFVHGSTVAINTAIERTGARTALIVTRGTRDVYQIARGNRPQSYNILFQRAEPLASAKLTFEVDQRTTAWGEALVAVRRSAGARGGQTGARQERRRHRYLLFAFLSGSGDEIRMGDILRELAPFEVHHHVARDRAQIGGV